MKTDHLPKTLFWLISALVISISALIYYSVEREKNLENMFNDDLMRKNEHIALLIEERDGHRARADFYLGQTYQLQSRVIWCQTGYNGDQKEYLAGLLGQIGLDLAEIHEGKPKQ